MNPEDFKASPSGRLVPTIQGVVAFVPNPLPPPKLDLNSLAGPIARANLALGELSGIGRALQIPFYSFVHLCALKRLHPQKLKELSRHCQSF